MELRLLLLILAEAPRRRTPDTALGPRRRTRRGPHPVDLHVGARIRNRRLVLGMSQTELGKAVGLTFQPVQKYENATNRISASRLAEVAAILKVPAAYFFDGLP